MPEYRLPPAAQFLPLYRAACEAAKERPSATFDDFHERVRANSPADLRTKPT